MVHQLPQNIGIIGVGSIGSALAELFRPHYNVALYDPDRGFTDKIEGADLVFIAVPTHAVEEAFLHVDNSNGVLVICSTVSPGTTQFLANETGQELLIHQPLFCNEDTAAEDLREAGVLVAGVVTWGLGKYLAQVWEPVVTRDPLLVTCRPIEAELLKLAANSFYALKVAWAGELYDVAEEYGADYEVVRAGLEMMRYVYPHHLDVHHKGYRGFGGDCLPKDARLLLEASRVNGNEMVTMKAALEANDKWR